MQKENKVLILNTTDGIDIPEIINVSEVEKTVKNISYCYSYLDEVKRNVNNTVYEMRNCFLSSY